MKKENKKTSVNFTSSPITDAEIMQVQFPQLGIIVVNGDDGGLWAKRSDLPDTQVPPAILTAFSSLPTLFPYVRIMEQGGWTGRGEPCITFGTLDTLIITLSKNAAGKNRTPKKDALRRVLRNHADQHPTLRNIPFQKIAGRYTPVPLRPGEERIAGTASPDKGLCIPFNPPSPDIPLTEALAETDPGRRRTVYRDTVLSWAGELAGRAGLSLAQLDYESHCSVQDPASRAALRTELLERFALLILAAYGRAETPGGYLPFLPYIQGEQGSGKTPFCETILGRALSCGHQPAYHASSLEKLTADDKEVLESVAPEVRVVEVIDSRDRSKGRGYTDEEVEEQIKAMTDRTVLRATKKYQKHITVAPVWWMTYITTNRRKFLRDTTGLTRALVHRFAHGDYRPGEEKGSPVREKRIRAVYRVMDAAATNIIGGLLTSRRALLARGEEPIPLLDPPHLKRSEEKPWASRPWLYTPAGYKTVHLTDRSAGTIMDDERHDDLTDELRETLREHLKDFQRSITSDALTGLAARVFKVSGVSGNSGPTVAARSILAAERYRISMQIRLPNRGRVKQRAHLSPAGDCPEVVVGWKAGTPLLPIILNREAPQNKTGTDDP